MIVDLRRRWMGYSPRQVARTLSEMDQEHVQKVAALRLEIAQAREAASAVEQAVIELSGRMVELEPQVDDLLLALAEAQERERQAIQQMDQPSSVTADEETQRHLDEAAKQERLLSHLWELQGSLAEALQHLADKHQAALVDAMRHEGSGLGGRR